MKNSIAMIIERFRKRVALAPSVTSTRSIRRNQRDCESPRRGRSWIAVMVVGLMTALGGVSPVLAQSQGASYTVQPGDVLEISVWKESDLQREVLVAPDGKLSFPLVGVVDVGDMNATQIQNVLTKKLAQFIPDPVVTVVIKALEGNKVYVIGQVNQPGAYTATREIDVIQALSMAGGMTPFAATSKIKILRRRGGVQTSTPFNYDLIEKGNDLKQNVILSGGDIVIVP